MDSTNDLRSENAPDWTNDLIEHLAALSAILQRWLDRPPQDPDSLLTAEQLGELLQLSPRTLKDQAAAGELPHHRLGKHYRFSRGDIQKILKLTQEAHGPDSKRIPARRSKSG